MKLGAEDNDRTSKELNPETDFPFNPRDYHELVLLNNKVLTLGAVIEAKQQENPTMAKLAYHELIAAPTSSIPGFFEIKPLSCAQVFARMQPVTLEDNGEVTKGVTSTIGSTIQLTHWTADRMKIIWQVKWMQKGLMPVCPRVILTFNAKLDVGMAVMLSS